jgi:hypothetical protein
MGSFRGAVALANRKGFELGWTGVTDRYRLVDSVTHLPELNMHEASLDFSLAEVTAFLQPIHDR